MQATNAFKRTHLDHFRRPRKSDPYGVKFGILVNHYLDQKIDKKGQIQLTKCAIHILTLTFALSFSPGPTQQGQNGEGQNHDSYPASLQSLNKTKLTQPPEMR